METSGSGVLQWRHQTDSSSSCARTRGSRKSGWTPSDRSCPSPCRRRIMPVSTKLEGARTQWQRCGIRFRIVFALLTGSKHEGNALQNNRTTTYPWPWYLCLLAAEANIKHKRWNTERCDDRPTMNWTRQQTATCCQWISTDWSLCCIQSWPDCTTAGIRLELTLDLIRTEHFVKDNYIYKLLNLQICVITMLTKKYMFFSNMFGVFQNSFKKYIT